MSRTLKGMGHKCRARFSVPLLAQMLGAMLAYSQACPARLGALRACSRVREHGTRCRRISTFPRRSLFLPPARLCAGQTKFQAFREKFTKLVAGGVVYCA